MLRSLATVTMAAIVAILAVAFLAVWQFAGIGSMEPVFLTSSLDAPQRSAMLVRSPAPHLQFTIGRHGGHAVAAILTLGGINITPAGLGLKLKNAGPNPKAELSAGGTTFQVGHADDPPAAVSETTAHQAAGSGKALDLSRPIRAGPGDAQTIDARVAPSDCPDEV